LLLAYQSQAKVVRRIIAFRGGDLSTVQHKFGKDNV